MADHTMEPGRTGWRDPDEAPAHGPLSHCWWDRTAKCWRLALKPAGKVLVAEFLAKYPNPAAILSRMTYPSAAPLLFRKWMGAGDERAELAGSAAMLGVVRAAMKFQPSKGYVFATFAPYYIFSEIQNLDRDEAKHHEASHERPDQQTGWRNSDPFESGWNIVDEAEAKRSPLHQADAQDAVDTYLAALPDRERQILAELYLSGARTTLGDVGRKHGVTKERIRQLKGKAIHAIRKNFLDATAA